MGSENSKSEEGQESQRKETRREVGQRLYTEEEIHRALANQKRMFEAKQLEMKTSSGIYPNLQTQNLNTINGPSTSSAIHYSVTPTAPPENLLPSTINTPMSRQTYQQRSSPAQASTPLPRPATATAAGPSNATMTSSRPSNGTQTSAGPSNATPTFTGPSNYPSTSAAPTKGTPINFFNQDRRTRSRSRARQNKRESNNIVNCVTCNGPLSMHIYQCTNGHSSCNGCRFKMARCGNCSQSITNMRNITLESTLAEVTINTEERIKCSNAKDGCCLRFKRTELQNHLKECPFNIISCPVMEFSGDCSWKGTIKQLATHFNEAHPMHCEAEVNKEMHIIVMQLDYKVMHLVKIGFHQFLVHIQVDTSLKNIYMVTQFLGTNYSASKWTYEWHVYNKREPRRKFEYIDVCKSNATPVSEIVNGHNCAIINMDYAKSFLDGGKLNYKFYIKKQFNNKKDVDTTSN